MSDNAIDYLVRILLSEKSRLGRCYHMAPGTVNVNGIECRKYWVRDYDVYFLEIGG